MSVRIYKYSNANLRARKARILQEARNLIGSKGFDGLTMRELASKSDVALATLYNIYGSKDVLVSYAVNDFFEPIIAAGVKKTLAKTSLDRLLTLLDQISSHVRRSSAYVQVIAAMYFKLDRDQGVHKMLYRLAHAEFTEILGQINKEIAFGDWVSIDLLAAEMSEQVMWRVFQWSQGLLPASQLADYMKYSSLMILASSTPDATDGAAHALLQQTTRKLAKSREKMRPAGG